MLHILHSPLGVSPACCLAEGCDDKGFYNVKVVLAGGVWVSPFFADPVAMEVFKDVVCFLEFLDCQEDEVGEGREVSVLGL